MKTRNIIWMMLMMHSSILFAQVNQSQTGTIKGKVVDQVNKKPIEFASLHISNNTFQKQKYTDKDGKFEFNDLPLDTYQISISYTGFEKTTIKGLIINSTKKIAIRNVELSSKNLREVIISDKAEPLIDKDDPTQSSFKSTQKNATRSVNCIAGISRGVGSYAGNSVNIRGSRSEEIAYYIDGVSTVENNEQYQQVEENSFQVTSLNPLSTFSIDVDKASYANVRRYLNNNTLPPIDAVRVEELINYFDYQIAAKPSIHPFTIQSEVANAPWDANKKLVHITLKAPDIDLSKAPQNNLTFLIDVSGSMGSEDKLPLLKNCIKLLVKNLRPTDKVSIVVYAGAAGLVLEPTFGSNQSKIMAALEHLYAGGSTAGGEGIQLAYKIAKENFIINGNNRIILATDGDFNVGTSSVTGLTELIEEKRKTGIYLSVLGFGTGNINDQTMELLADKGNGNYNYIDGILEGKKVLVNELGGTLYTIANDVKIQIEFNPKYVKLYKLIGYENRMLASKDFNDDKKDAGELGAGHCVTAIYEIITDAPDTNTIDPLKYQNNKLSDIANANELMTIKVRYKKPKDSSSIKLELPIYNQSQELAKASKEMQFAVSVALFGLKLRQSKTVNTVSYKEILQLSKSAKGADDNGYRAEFIKLVETAELLAKN
ncbi:MAG: von Willebrand factor type A domain-containing protein [Bacteroidota bacterium]